MFVLKRFSNLNKILFNSRNIIRLKSSYSYAFEPSLEPYSVLTIGQLIEDCAQDSGHKTACVSVHQNIQKTYAELNSDINRLALSLKRIGCSKGDRVGIWAPNCYEWLLTQYATAKIGAILVNVNPGYRAKELEYCLNLVQCNTLICTQKFRTSDYCQILDSISPNILINTNGVEVQCEKIPSLKNLIMINSSNGEETAPSGVVRFNDFITNSDITVDAVEAVSQPDDSINIQFTSGTTGNPKAATLTHHNIVQNAQFVAKRMLEGMSDPPSLCLPNPLYHCFGSVIGSIVVAMKRGTIVLPAPVFNATKTLETIHNYKCDLIYGTPTMYIDILDSNPDKFNTSSLIRGLMSGAPCPPPLIERVQSKFQNLDILIPYGSTESSPVVTHTSMKDSKKHRLESVGRPIDHVEIKVIDPETGALKRTGETGEVCSRGHCNFVGYWAQKQATDSVLDQNRWYHTGVVGVSDERWGEDLVAYIKLKEKSSLDPRAVREFCKGKISHFKIPQNIEFVEDFPRTVTGKVQKFKLKEIAEKQFKK